MNSSFYINVDIQRILCRCGGKKYYVCGYKTATQTKILVLYGEQTMRYPAVELVTTSTTYARRRLRYNEREKKYQQDNIKWNRTNKKKIIVALAIRQCVAWASTLITHKHSRQKETTEIFLKNIQTKKHTPTNNTNRVYLSKYLKNCSVRDEYRSKKRVLVPVIKHRASYVYYWNKFYLASCMWYLVNYISHILRIHQVLVWFMVCYVLGISQMKSNLRMHSVRRASVNNRLCAVMLSFFTYLRACFLKI